MNRINYSWWKKLFSSELRERIPDLFYITNEEVAIGMLNKLLQDTDNLFSKILFDPTMREDTINTFTGVTGCWDSDDTRGSMLFWGIDQNDHTKIQLRVEDDQLVSTDPKRPFTVQLNKESILEALNNGQMYPTMFMVYGISSFYCGVRPLVGYGSMTYHTAMKNAWLQLLKQHDQEEADRVNTIPVNGFIGGPSTSFGYDPKRGYENLYALDVMARGGFSTAYLEHLHQTKLSDILLPALIDIYDSYVPQQDKQPITITANDLMGEPFSWLKELQV